MRLLRSAATLLTTISALALMGCAGSIKSASSPMAGAYRPTVSPELLATPLEYPPFLLQEDGSMSRRQCLTNLKTALSVGRINRADQIELQNETRLIEGQALTTERKP